MEKSTIIGMVLAVIAVGVGMVLKGASLAALANPAALLIIFVGTAASLFIGFPLEDMKKFPKLMKIVFTEQKYFTKIELVEMFTNWVNITRREGLLSLESQIETVENSFLKGGLFESGSATVKPESRKLAVTISEMLGQYPGYEVSVAGYTDNIPISKGEFSDNWELSSKRALNFMRLLLANKSLEPSNLSSTGYGEYHEIDSNDTAAGRAVNRRVEVSVLRNIKVPNN